MLIISLLFSLLVGCGEKTSPEQDTGERDEAVGYALQLPFSDDFEDIEQSCEWWDVYGCPDDGGGTPAGGTIRFELSEDDPHGGSHHVQTIDHGLVNYAWGGEKVSGSADGLHMRNYYLDLSDHPSPVLKFYNIRDVAPIDYEADEYQGAGDSSCFIKARLVDSDWEVVAALSSNTGSWQMDTISLAEYGGYDAVQIAFDIDGYFTADGTITWWSIDDVLVTDEE
jgi:hypothetical protein